ncbi:hypothetical protein V8B97DRAFT_1919293 [Scleroderma yunnanense]
MVFKVRTQLLSSANFCKSFTSSFSTIQVEILNIFLVFNMIPSGGRNKTYALQPGKFASVVGSQLAILKTKYQHHAARFKSTEEGINPNDPECCWNLLEQVTVKFLFWVDCNCMWHSNPTYDACLFNPTPSTNQSGDFLSIIKHGGATAAPTPSGSTQGQSSDHTNMAAEKLGNGHFRGTTTHNYTNTSRTAGTPMGGLEEDEDEDEDEEEQVEKNRGNKGEIFGGFSYDPIDILPGPKLAAPVVVDEQQEIRDNTTPQAIPSKPQASLKSQTLSWDNCSAFQMSPYPKSPASIISSSMSSSSFTGSSLCTGINLETSQTSFMKAKDLLTQMKAELMGQLSGLSDGAADRCYRMAVLKTECKSTRVKAYLHNKEIAHLEVEKEECVEAERAHCCMIESKRMDVEVLKEESEVLCLKLELVKLQAGQNTTTSMLSSMDP